jgi:TonB family protein
MNSTAKYFIVSALCFMTTANVGIGVQQEETVYDQDLKLVSFEDLAYPSVARMTRVQGVVVVKVKLADDGSVSSASALSGNKTLIPDTLSNVKKWRFKPNTSKSAVIVYDFRLTDGACHDNSHSLFELTHPNFASIMACSPVING